MTFTPINLDEMERLVAADADANPLAFETTVRNCELLWLIRIAKAAKSAIDHRRAETVTGLIADGAAYEEAIYDIAALFAEGP